MVDDGKPVDAPSRITFIDGSEREEIKPRDNRYCVPESMMDASTVDLAFDAAGSRFHLFHVRMDILDADWDISFGSKRYARDEKLAKTINVEESCTLHIHHGDAEKNLTLAGCRLELARQGR